MPKQSEELALLKDAQFEQTLALIVKGATKAEACEEMGFNVRSFDRMMVRRRDLVHKYVAALRLSVQEQYGDIMGARQLALEKLISALEQENLKPEQVIALERRISEIQTELEKQIAPLMDGGNGGDGGGSSAGAAENYLKTLESPKLRKAVSRITRTTTETIELVGDDQNGNSDSSSDIVDGETQDSDADRPMTLGASTEG